MAIGTLDPQTIAAINNASPSGVASFFAALHGNLSIDQWLPVNNRYRVECTDRISADIQTATGVRNNDMGQYIAASVPLHCFDGWTFLARALTAYINGNPHQAAHFAYYAELRASMSILASRGIGVFKNRHFYIDATGKCNLLFSRRGTHEFAWLALEAWSKKASSGSDLLKLLTASGVSISDWFSPVPSAPVASSTASKWLKEWGIDLATVETDHDVRNLASYRPNEFSSWDSDARGCSAFLRGIWSLFEPSTTSFEALDRELLRSLVQRVIVNSGTHAGPLRQARINSEINVMLNGLPISDSARNAQRTFLLSSAPPPLLLTLGQSTGSMNDSNIHERVIARAALLLRVASGFCVELIESVPFQVDDLKFWTGPWAGRRSFWRDGQALDNLADLWLDVAVAIEDETDWFAMHDAGDTISMHEWRDQREAIIRPMTECDRIALWGLAR
jgi:hypothetical protein